MKKLFYLLSIIALAFISCQKEELVDNNSTEGKYTYTFVVNQMPEAKATIGDKNGNQWPVLWEKGDKIGVYDVLTEEFVGTADISDESAGKNSAVFTLNTEVLINDGDELYFSYPHVEGAVFKTGKIATKQTLNSANVGANAVAYAIADYSAEGTSFTLNHTNAYLKFNVSAAKGFSGYTLEGITFWADGAELSGDVTIGDGGKLTVTGAEDYAKATLGTPVTLGAAAQTLWLTALPADLSANETVYAIAHLSKGVETVTIPVKFPKGGELKAGSVTEITLPALSTALAPAWYEPVETRYVAAYGDGWSYGSENTVLFTNTNLQEAEKVVDFKARGNFMKVKEPAKVQVKYADSFGATNNFVRVWNEGGSYTDILPGGDSFDLHSDYTLPMSIVRKKADTEGQMSAILLQDKDGNTLWGINLWLIKQTMSLHAIAGEQVMAWNMGASIDATSNTWRCGGCYFQWGRPFAFPWSTKLFTGLLIVADNDLEKSAENPYEMFYYADGIPNDWYYAKGLGDLWGNPSTSGSGVKSIYDPCPKGYRVISPAVINEIANKTSLSEEKEFTVTDPVEYVQGSGMYYLKYNDFTLPFAGGFFNNGGAISRPNDNNTNVLAAYWTNAASGANGHCYFFQNSDGVPYNLKMNSGKATAFPVRCMVDTENR